jgi:hypothetical protein
VCWWMDGLNSVVSSQPVSHLVQPVGRSTTRASPSTPIQSGGVAPPPPRPPAQPTLSPTHTCTHAAITHTHTAHTQTQHAQHAQHAPVTRGVVAVHDGEGEEAHARPAGDELEEDEEVPTQALAAAVGVDE